MAPGLSPSGRVAVVVVEVVVVVEAVVLLMMTIVVIVARAEQSRPRNPRVAGTGTAAERAVAAGAAKAG
jgi:hypothetical protein